MYPFYEALERAASKEKTTTMVPTPPINAAGTVPNRGRRYAGFKFSELIGRADKYLIDRTDPTPHFIRRSKLYQGRADNNADNIGPAKNDQCQTGQIK